MSPAVDNVLAPLAFHDRPPTSGSSLARRFTAIVLSCALAFTFAGSSAATTRSKLHSATSQLVLMTEQMKSQEAKAAQAEDRLSGLNAQIQTASQKVDQIAGQLVYAQKAIADLSSQETDLRSRLNDMAQTLFMQGSGSLQGAFLGSILSSTSMADFTDRMADAQALGQADVDLVDRLAAVKAGLTQQEDRLKGLQSQQVQILSDLTKTRDEQGRALAEDRRAMSELDATKSAIVQLISKLHRRLLAQALSEVGTAFQGSGHISYGAWAGQLLSTIGAPRCHSNMVVVVTWQYSEFTQAMWNPLADSLPMPGSTSFNSSNIQNYPSLAVGLQAVKKTLWGGQSLGYSQIVASLERCSDPMTSARAINASAWCRGCTGGQYVTGKIATVEANYSVYAKL
jgi:peptidoglycan hydrolase CwlO-like protein